MEIVNPGYKQQLQELHQDNRFNRSGSKLLKKIQPFLDQYNPSSILDFGCGHGHLIESIQSQYPNITVDGYDPGSIQYQTLPTGTFDAVVSLDAIEHIEPELLIVNFEKLDAMIKRCAFFRIACYPAKKRLPDGRNCHLIVEHPDWWRSKLLTIMNVNIVKEKILVFDKSAIWPGVLGHIYDVVLEKK